MAWFSHTGKALRAILGLKDRDNRLRPIRKKAPAPIRLSIETLEDRVVPAKVNWINLAGGDWDVPGNWSTDSLPQSGDDVTIPTLNSGATVTHSNGTDVVHSVTSSGNIVLSGGSLTVSQDLSLIGGSTLFLQGGTLIGAQLQANSTLTLTGLGGVLQQVTIEANATIDGTQPSQSGNDLATVQGSLELDGTLKLGGANSSGQLYFQGTTTQPQVALTGTGSVVFGSSGNALIAEAAGGLDLTNPVTLTIGSNITIQGGGGSVAGFVPSSDNVILDGNIDVQNLVIAGSNWVNNGTITEGSGDTLGIAGTTTIQGIGTLNAAGATVDITGTLNNANSTIALTSNLGNWFLQGGTINGGTIQSLDSSVLTLTQYGGTLAGVTVAANTTIDGTQVPSFGENQVTITGGFTLDGSLNLGATNGQSSGEAYFRGTQMLTGSGSINFGSAGNSIFARSTSSNDSSTPATLTIGPSITITAGNSANNTIGQGFIDDYTAADSIINEGIVISTVTGSFITFGVGNVTSPTALGNFTNDGTFEADIGTTIEISANGNFVNYNVAKLSLNDGIYIIGGTFLFPADGINPNPPSPLTVPIIIGTNNANLTLDGPQARILDLNTSDDALFDLEANSPTATLVLENGAFLVVPAFTNFGRLDINGAASGIESITTYSQSAPVPANSTGGTTTLEDGGAFGGDLGVTLGSGTVVEGDGLIFGNLINSGELLPTNDEKSFLISGSIEIGGNYNQTGTGIIDIPILSGSDFGTINVDGSAGLGGTIQLMFPTGYEPQATDTPDIITYSQGSGDFTIFKNFNPGGAFGFAEPEFPEVIKPTYQLFTYSLFGSTIGALPSTVTYSESAQLVSLTGTAEGTGFFAGPIFEGALTFVVTDKNTGKIIATSLPTEPANNVSGGLGSATVELPADLPVGSNYVITATYSDQYVTATPHAIPPNFQDGTAVGTLTVIKASTTSVVTTNPTVTFSESDQTCTLSADVTSAAGVLNEGTVTFTVFGQNNNVIGQAVTSTTLVNGATSVTYKIPANTPAGTYFVQAQYNGTSSFVGSASSSENSGALTVGSAPTTTTVTGTPVSVFSPVAQTVTLSAAVTSPGGTVNEGTIVFTVFDSSNNQVGLPVVSAVVNGATTATYTVPGGTQLGVYTVQAQYSDASTKDFAASTGTAQNLSVVPTPTTTTASAASVPFNESPSTVTLNASVSSNGGVVNEGAVAFTITSSNNTVLGTVTSKTVSNGQASAVFQVPANTPAGSYSVTASFIDSLPLPGFGNSTDSSKTLTITPAVTTTDTSSDTVVFEQTSQQVALSATVTSAAGDVNEGTVEFTILNSSNAQVGNPVFSSTVQDGAASASFAVPAGTPAGTYTIKANYTDATPGDFASSTNSNSLNVSQAPTTTASASTSVAFSETVQSVTLNASITSQNGAINEGTVTFTVIGPNGDIGNPVTSGTVSNGTTSTVFSLPANTPAGVYTIQAQYNDVGGEFATSTSSGVQNGNLFIGKALTSAVAATNTTPYSLSAQNLQLTASVSSLAGAINEGLFTFTVTDKNNNTLGQSVKSGTVTNGTATATYALPAGTPVGTYSITVQYSDPGSSADFAGSQSLAANLTVTPATTTTSTTNLLTPVSSSPQTLTLSASVTSAAGSVSEGNVAFTILDSHDNVIGSQSSGGKVSSGIGTVSYIIPANTPPGFYTIDVTYTDSTPGDFASSTDTSHTLAVKAATTTTISSQQTTFSSLAQTLSLTATITSADNTIPNEGTVTFLIVDSHNNPIGSSVTSSTVSGGQATVSYVIPANTVVGSYTIEATYNDSTTGRYLGSTATTVPLTIQQAPTTTTAGSLNLSYNVASTQITLNATVTSPTGPVNEGTVKFTVLAGSSVVGSSVTSGTVSNGAASVTFTVPAGTAAGSYSVLAQYSDSVGNYLSSDDSASLSPIVVAPALTTTTVNTAYIEENSTTESVVLAATVSSTFGVINEGVVTFTVFQGNTQIGTPVTSSTLGAGSVKANYPIPGGTAAGFYTIQAVYSGGANFAPAATATGTLVIDLPPSLSQLAPGNTITLTHDQFPYTSTANASSSIGLPINYSSTVTGDSTLYDLESQYQFQGLGYLTAGATAYVLHSNQPGAGVGGYYLLRPADGALFAYDGSGSYAHTFTNGSSLATLGANTYTDPGLLLNAQAPVDYATLYALQQQYQFKGLGYLTAGAPAYVLTSTVLNSFNNPYYLLKTDGSLYAYDGSGNYAHTFANVPPLSNLGAGVYASPNALLNAEASPTIYSQLYQLNQQYDLQEFNGSFYTNTYGHNAKWIYSPVLNQYGQHWYTVTLSSDGTQAILRAWEGYQDSAVGAVIATLDPSVFTNPSLLTNATALPNPAANVTVNSSGGYSITPPSGFVGTFKVTIAASDGFLSTSQTLVVNSTDTAPTLTVQDQNSNTISPNGTQTVSHGSFPLSDAILTADAEHDPVTATASVVSYSLPFALEQQYQFKGLGYNTAGSTAYVLQAVNNNSFGNPYYLLSSSGGLYAYDGSGSYSHTFNNVSPLATLGANYYVDPTLMLSAEAPVDYSDLYSFQQQYAFQGLGYLTAGTTAYVLHSTQSGPGVGGYYLLTANGSLYAYDGSSTYTATIANSANLLVTFDPSVYANPSILLNAKANPTLYSQFYQAEQQFDLQESQGSFYTGLMGNAAKWLYSPIANANGRNWYTLVLSSDGTQALLYAWDGGTSSVPTGAKPVATLDSSVYYDPTLLLNAKTPLIASGVTATVSNGSVVINAPTSFVGSLLVTVTASDGSLTTSQSFRVTSMDSAPQIVPIAPQTASASGSPLQITLGATDTDNDIVTFSAALAGYNTAYNLQRIYQFRGIGYLTNNGVTAYVMSSAVLGGSGGYYLLTANGNVYAYDGSGNYATTIANSANIVGTVDPSVYNTPTLLTKAQVPAPPAASIGITGSKLTINVAGLAVGTVFEVLVTANDGAETTTTGFLVTVGP
jgi:hypothetical protein